MFSSHYRTPRLQWHRLHSFLGQKRISLYWKSRLYSDIPLTVTYFGRPNTVPVSGEGCIMKILQRTITKQTSFKSEWYIWSTVTLLSPSNFTLILHYTLDYLEFWIKQFLSQNLGTPCVMMSQMQHLIHNLREEKLHCAVNFTSCHFPQWVWMVEVILGAR